MKDSPTQIRQQVEETLAVWERIRPGEAPPFLLTRVEAAIAGSRPRGVRNWQWALAAAIVLLNLGLVSWDWVKTSRTSEQALVQSIWSEYDQDTGYEFAVPNNLSDS